jgi:hypothetical protein
LGIVLVSRLSLALPPGRALRRTKKMTEKNNKRTKRQKEFLRRLTESKERLLSVIEGLDEATICHEPVVGAWTIKDVLVHNVSWNEEFRANIAMILGGKHLGFDHTISEEDDFREWNQQWINLKSDATLGEVMADVLRDYQEVAELIERLRPDDYRMRGVTPWKASAVEKPKELTKEDTDTVETLVTYHWRHANEHIGEIEKWRKKRESRDR